MAEEIGPLPVRWVKRIKAKHRDTDDEKYTLEEWLMELYFDTDEKALFSQERMQSRASLIVMLMRFEPSERVVAAEALHHDCLK